MNIYVVENRCYYRCMVREKDGNMQKIVFVDESTGTVTVKNPTGAGDPKVFTFDQAYGKFFYRPMSLPLYQFYNHFLLLVNQSYNFVYVPNTHSIPSVLCDSFRFFTSTVTTSFFKGPGDELTVQGNIYNKTAAPLVESVIEVCRQML